VPLGWEHQKRLARLTGIVVDLADIPNAGSYDDSGAQATNGYLVELQAEIARVFSPGGDLAVEFERLFPAGTTIPPQTRAAAMAGWLKAVLATDAYEASQVDAAPAEKSRKLTIGFRAGQPLVEELPASAD